MFQLPTKTMENQTSEIKGLTLDEISEQMGLDKNLVKKYIENELKEEIKNERVLMPDGKYDPYILDLILIQLEVDRAGLNLEKSLQIVREMKQNKAA